jgi:hypothetical protein
MLQEHSTTYWSCEWCLLTLHLRISITSGCSSSRYQGSGSEFEPGPTWKKTAMLISRPTSRHSLIDDILSLLVSCYGCTATPLGTVQSCIVQDLSCLLFVRNQRARYKVSEAGNTSPPTRRGAGTSSCCKSPRTRSQLTTADTTPKCSCPSPSQTSSAKSSTRCYQKNSH